MNNYYQFNFVALYYLFSVLLVTYYNNYFDINYFLHKTLRFLLHHHTYTKFFVT